MDNTVLPAADSSGVLWSSMPDHELWGRIGTVLRGVKSLQGRIRRLSRKGVPFSEYAHLQTCIDELRHDLPAMRAEWNKRKAANRAELKRLLDEAARDAHES